MADSILYDGVSREDWIDELASFRYWIRRHLYAMFSALDVPATMLDVGCGLGELVNISRMLGLQAWGIDQLCDSTYPAEFFAHHNLCSPFSLTQIKEAPSVVDWVICWEVGEHIPDEFINIFCDTLCNHVIREGYLFFTAAHPGQGGTEHISARPARFWHDKFYERGLNFKERETDKVKIAWLNMESPMFWLPANIGVFQR